MSTWIARSAYQIRVEGWQALTERLGPSGAMRFMMQYDPGHGDYTRERQALFAEVGLDELLREAANVTAREAKPSRTNER